MCYRYVRAVSGGTDLKKKTKKTGHGPPVWATDMDHRYVKPICDTGMWFRLRFRFDGIGKEKKRTGMDNRYGWIKCATGEIPVSTFELRSRIAF
jgi:hypothetical protein